MPNYRVPPYYKWYYNPNVDVLDPNKHGPWNKDNYYLYNDLWYRLINRDDSKNIFESEPVDEDLVEDERLRRYYNENTGIAKQAYDFVRYGLDHYRTRGNDIKVEQPASTRVRRPITTIKRKIVRNEGNY